MGGGGGGGGGYFIGRVDPSELARKISDAKTSTDNAAYEISVNQLLNEVLSKLNDRDAAAIQAILDRIRVDFTKEFEGTVDILFGGSVSKNTYLEGLSDIDALVLLKPDQIQGRTPSEVRKTFAELLQTRFGGTNVKIGRLAVTLTLEGKEIQLVPAIREGIGFRISNPKADDWASIRPRRFAEKLTRSNKEMEGKLVPVIKLAKSIIARLPDQQQLSGYHCEALAIEAFRNYGGEKTVKAMLHHFFEAGRQKVLGQIKDSTGQSVHVDEYLGSENSLARRVVADAFERVSRRISNADVAKSREFWNSIVNAP
jgi:hypothetical protein